MQARPKSPYKAHQSYKQMLIVDIPRYNVEHVPRHTIVDLLPTTSGQCMCTAQRVLLITYPFVRHVFVVIMRYITECDTHGYMECTHNVYEFSITYHHTRYTMHTVCGVGVRACVRACV